MVGTCEHLFYIINGAVCSINIISFNLCDNTMHWVLHFPFCSCASWDSNTYDIVKTEHWLRGGAKNQQQSIILKKKKSPLPTHKNLKLVCDVEVSHLHSW